MQTAKEGYVINSPVFGLKLEQYLFESIYFSWESIVTHKYVDVFINGFVTEPVYGIEFNYFQQYFSLRYRIVNSIYIGAGNFDLELYYYRNSSKLDAYDFKSFQLDPISSYGINLSYELKLFDRIKLFDKKGQSCPAF
ncbi:MAG TPA: hypothetical protein VK590_06130 [Saprospiraceae bacterium]|nr:hypothetical protein [Saprospiraceae bacterium]